jgi:hypothetical protein
MSAEPGPAATGEIPRATLFNGIVTCPHCGGWIEPGVDHSGQVVACPHCGGHFHLPETIEPGFVPHPGQLGTSTPKEPWFYGFIEAYANVWMWLAILVTALFILIAAAVTLSMQTATIPTSKASWLKLIFLAAAVAVSLSGLIGILLSVAFMRLAVDIGRNLRAIRHCHRDAQS